MLARLSPYNAQGILVNTAQLEAISPLDGRYASQVESLGEFFSEAALMKFRSKIEIEWMIFMSEKAIIKNAQIDAKALRKIYHDFSLDDAAKVKAFEKTTNHDVKAIEYFLKEKTKVHASFWHFACTSEDINNLAYALMIKESLQQILQTEIQSLIDLIQNKADEYANIAMLARTHGQAASPTTLGKEFANFAYRLNRQIQQLKNQEILGKFHGAVGNFNAHVIACPNQDWPALAKEFVEGLGLCFNPMVTQIEPHDFIAELAQNFIRINNILLGLARDAWTYISLDYFKLKVIKDEVGSSTMPHKVNPIDFENAEGNLGLANALFTHFAEKLPISRLQRDLSDSTVLRNIGTAFAYSLIAYRSFSKGLNKLSPNHNKIEADLKDRYEVLTEAIQTVLRYHGILDAYEQLKEASRGQVFNKEAYLQCVEKIDLPGNVKANLKALKPETYIGLASTLAAMTKPQKS